MLGLACPKKPREMAGPSACTAAGGQCALASDGYYSVSSASLALGLVLAGVYLWQLPALVRLPLHRWRAGGGAGARA